MGTTFRSLFAFAVVVVVPACSDSYSSGSKPGPTDPGPTTPVPTVVSATGSITAAVDQFRAALGDPVNTVAGEQAAGRREIGWDGAAANPFNNKNDFPAAFFNTTAKSGAVFTTPGTGFRNDSTKFVEVNASYGAEFATFSPTKIFAPVGSNVMEVHFQVAGQPTDATVTGFGAVFSDVDVAGKSTIELFDKTGKSLGVFAAPTRSDAAGLSFVGAKFADPIVAFARITMGTGSLGATTTDISAGGTLDLVVVDNFFYGEPKHIP